MQANTRPNSHRYTLLNESALCLLYLSSSVLRSSEAAVETNETRLYKELFKNYNKYIHPVIDESQPVRVVFDFQLIRIIDVVSHTYLLRCFRDRFLHPVYQVQFAEKLDF